MRTRLALLALLILLGGLFLPETNVSLAPGPDSQLLRKKHVLVLQSYHQGQSWQDGVLNGIRAVTAPLGRQIELHVENLDTKRVPGTQAFAPMAALIETKYGAYPWDAILTTDDAAFQFARQYRQQLFPHAQLVFCGVNDYTTYQPYDRTLETGVAETIDPKKSIEVALRLNPNTRQIYVINDFTLTGIYTKSVLLKSLPEIPNLPPIIHLDNMSMEDLLSTVKNLPADSMILLLLYNTDRLGVYYDYEDSIDLLYSVSPVPIYATWDFYLGRGIVGGRLTNSYAQGHKAMEMVLALLNGVPTAELPLVTDGPTNYIFDYEQLQRWHIPRNLLPPDSLIINEPQSFYNQYRQLVLTTISIFILLLLIIALLTNNIRRRKQAEQNYQILNAELEERVLSRTNALQLANAQLKQTLEELQLAQQQMLENERLASLGNLVAGIAHEINTPIGLGLTSISFLEAKLRDFTQQYTVNQLRRSDLDKFVQASQDSIRSLTVNLDRAAQLIRSFKQVAVDQSSEQRRRFRLAEYIRDILTSLAPQIKNTPHRITVTCAEELEVDSYPGAFFQILSNLIQNSLVHAFDQDIAGHIYISALIDGDQLLITFSDDGKGMDRDYYQHLFEPFFTTKRTEGGTGLGLHTVYNIITHQLGGSIRCKSAPGEGTAFAINIPIPNKGESNHAN